MYILFKLCTAFFTAQSTSRKGKSTKFFLFRRIYHSTGTGLFPVPGCFWFPFLTLCPLPPTTRRTAERGREAKKDVLSCLTGRPSGGGRGVVLELLSPLSLTGTSFSRSPYKRKKAPGSCRGLSSYARISLTRFSTAAVSQPELFSWAAMSWASFSAAQ